MYGLFIRYGMKFLLALVVLIVGLIVIKYITRGHGEDDEKKKCQ